jgi:NAD(P)-dependent dehydrogenase (short-subunit alcohol dehydrogenase family)
VTGSILLITGAAPGSGKSTVARLVAERFDPAVSIVRGLIAPWLPDADAQNRTVLRTCFAAAAELASGRDTVVMNGPDT